MHQNAGGSHTIWMGTPQAHNAECGAGDWSCVGSRGTLHFREQRTQELQIDADSLAE